MDDRLDALPCGVLAFDDSGRILQVNRMLATLVGYEAHELIGASIDTILSVASRIFYNTHFFPLVRLYSKADEIFLTLIRRDRTDIPVLTNTVRRLDSGAYENVMALIPVFQRRKYENEIRCFELGCSFFFQKPSTLPDYVPIVMMVKRFAKSH